MTLTEFLLARIAEDEAASDRLELCPYFGVDVGSGHAHVSQARVLAECEAKRRIVEHQQEWARTLHETSDRYSDDQCTMYRMAMYWVLERLAEPYAGHADYPGNAE